MVFLVDDKNIRPKVVVIQKRLSFCPDSRTLLMLYIIAVPQSFN